MRGELDLAATISDLWRHRWLVVGFTVAFGGLGVAYALLATEWYEAQTVVIQNEDSSLPSGLAQLGGLASLAGISLDSGGKGQEPLAVLKSREFATEFIQQENLLPVLFADRWDQAKQVWKSIDPEDHPDVRDGVRYFVGKVRKISVDERTGLITLSVFWKNPDESARWANLLIAGVNDRLRRKALEEAERNIDFLTRTIAESRVVPLQQPLAKILESEMQKQMLAKGREEFAFRVIDPATPPKYKSKPKRALISVLATMLGMSAGILFVLVRRGVIREKSV